MCSLRVLGDTREGRKREKQIEREDEEKKIERERREEDLHATPALEKAISRSV